MNLAAVTGELERLADPERALRSQQYFGTGPGGDGEGDVFLGIPVPAQRRTARHAAGLSLADLATLLASPVHEHRFVALVILVDRYRRSGRAGRAALSTFYLDHLDGVNRWDLVDTSAPTLLGGELAAGSNPVLRELARSSRWWERRVAVLATFALIRAGEFDESFALADELIDDPHHLIHKATGWMLREIGKRDEPALVAWLAEHAPRMPRVMLRYATERLPAGTRAELLALPRAQRRFPAAAPPARHRR